MSKTKVQQLIATTAEFGGMDKQKSGELAKILSRWLQLKKKSATPNSRSTKDEENL